MKELIPEELIGHKIFLLRNQKVMLSIHLAKLYGVQVKVLMQAVKRNSERFPEDFMFQLTPGEAQSSRSQFVTLNNKDFKQRKVSKHDENIRNIFEAIHQLMAPPEKLKRRIGFHTD
ncbi:MAG: ORF6N domain-containing protein [Candidatus Omnitrophota bacterium]|jgi:hypothetical protein